MHINEMKKYDLITESKSEYSSPAMIVIKHSEEKRGKSRMVINYKKLNDFAIRNRYPIPKIELLFNLIRGKRVFSKFDCKSGFFQIKLEEESKKNILLLVHQKDYMNGMYYPWDSIILLD